MVIPKNQILWERLYGKDGILSQVVTSDITKTKWFLYSVDNNQKLTKIETGETPLFKKKLQYMNEM